MRRPGRLWRIAVIGLLISLPVQAHPERDEDGSVSVRADASDPLGAVFPSDLFTVHDYGQLTRRRTSNSKPSKRHARTATSALDAESPAARAAIGNASAPIR